MTRSFLKALACFALLAACNDDSGSGSKLDGGDQTGDGDGDGGAIGDGDSDVGDGDGDGVVGDGDGDGVVGDGDSGDAGATAGAHCSPGTFVKNLAGTGPNRADRCDDQGFEDALQAGVFEADNLADTSLWNIPLAVPTTMGESYALSIEIEHIGPDQTQQFELWGTNGTCAADGAATQIYSKKSPMGKYVHCIEITPAADYTALILVLRDLTDDDRVTGLRSATFCATGSCQ